MKRTWIIYLCLCLVLTLSLIVGCTGSTSDDGEDSICKICGETGNHARCVWCQVHTCVGDHTACATTANALAATADGVYTLAGVYDYTSLFGDRVVTSYLPGHYVWSYRLTIAGETFVLDFYIDEATAERKLISLEGNIAMTEGAGILTPATATAYYSSYASSTPLEASLTVYPVNTFVTLYDDHTFSGIVNLPISICPCCKGFTDIGVHTLCERCGKHLCNGEDHTSMAPCGLHTVCTAGAHNQTCDHCGGYLCNGEDHTSMAPCGLHTVCTAGVHDQICTHCGEYLCNGRDHTSLAPCRIHTVCTAGVHNQTCDHCGGYLCNGEDHTSMAPCGLHTVCVEGVHDKTCLRCTGYLCNGQDHNGIKSCGEHPSCIGGEHAVCVRCGNYQCNGRSHEVAGCNLHRVCEGGNHLRCEFCLGFLCTGNHEGCRKNACAGCQVENVQHEHCGFCQNFVCVGDHTRCVPAKDVTVVTSGWSGTYTLSGSVRSNSGGSWVSYDWQLRLSFADDGTYSLEWWQKSPSQTNYFGPLMRWTGEYTREGSSAKLAPTGGYVCDTSGGVKEELPVDTEVRTTVTMYSDNTFSGFVNGLLGKCETCGLDKEDNIKHDVSCLICGGALCTGNHLHGDRTMCGWCGQSYAVGSHGKCTECDGYYCDGGDHTSYAQPCGNHRACASGNHADCLYCGKSLCWNPHSHDRCSICKGAYCCAPSDAHTTCTHCGGSLCDGKSHDNCPQCGQPECKPGVDHSTCGAAKETALTAYAAGTYRGIATTASVVATMPEDPKQYLGV